MEWKQSTDFSRQPLRCPALFSLPQKIKEEAKIKKFHGIDKHKKYFTISVLNRQGEEIDFSQKCSDLKEYIENLGSEDAVVIESSTGAFYWAD